MLARNATLSRSWRLFQTFRQEQQNPDLFYQTLAADSVALVAADLTLDGIRMLDVGGGPGYFADAFRAAGAEYVAVDAAVGELSARGEATGGTVLGSAEALPFGDNRFDLVYSSNVWEHVAQPLRMLTEMVRVARPGGVVHLSYTVWFGPWGGHETSPWHYVGGSYARRRYLRRHHREPKNRWGESLFARSVRDGLAAARNLPDARLVEVYPRYLPGWAAGVVRVPVVRELLTWNLVLVLVKQ